MEEKKKKSITGLIIVNVILLIFVLMYVYDMVRASSFSMGLGLSEEDTNHTFDAWLADGKAGKIYVQLSDSSGTPVKGHSIYALVEIGDGTVRPNRVMTDEEGYAVFQFIVPIKTKEVLDRNGSVKQSDIKIYDEDNSVFFLVPKTRHLTIKYKAIDA